jgi:hypothetical protein
MEGKHLAAEARIALRHPDAGQGLPIHIAQHVAADLLLAPVYGAVTIVVRPGIARGYAAIPSYHQGAVLYKSAASLHALRMQVRQARLQSVVGSRWILRTSGRQGWRIRSPSRSSSQYSVSGSMCRRARNSSGRMRPRARWLSLWAWSHHKRNPPASSAPPNSRQGGPQTCGRITVLPERRLRGLSLRSRRVAAFRSAQDA